MRWLMVDSLRSALRALGHQRRRHRRPFERCPQAGARPVQADPCRHGLAVEHHGDLCRRQLLDRGQLQQLPVGLGQVGERTADNPDVIDLIDGGIRCRLTRRRFTAQPLQQGVVAPPRPLPVAQQVARHADQPRQGIIPADVLEPPPRDDVDVRHDVVRVGRCRATADHIREDAPVCRGEERVELRGRIVQRRGWHRRPFLPVWCRTVRSERNVTAQRVADPLDGGALPVSPRAVIVRHGRTAAVMEPVHIWITQPIPSMASSSMK
jgi:hypothetical protein